MKNSYQKFTLYTLLATAAIVVGLISLIVRVTFYAGDDTEAVIDRAIAWQLESGGVAALTDGNSQRYKDKMTVQRLASGEVQTLVLGSSTLLSLRPAMLPAQLLAFNGAKNANSLPRIIAEGLYYTARYPALQNLIIGFDWGLGGPYKPGRIRPFDPDASSLATPTPWQMIRDAISLQRLEITAAKLLSNTLTVSPEVYRCQREDASGMDVLPQDYPMICNGFRADGSATFARMNPVGKNGWQRRLKDERTERYRQGLRASAGEITPAYLAGLEQLQQTLAARGGRLIILIPPMLPGLVAQVRGSADGQYLQTTLQQLQALSVRSGIQLIDASASEQFDCDYREFMDSHHAFPGCYLKVMAATL